MASEERLAILAEISVERDRQDAKFGDQVARPNGTGGRGFAIAARNAKEEYRVSAETGAQTWAHILREEVYEALEVTDVDPEDFEHLREELIQVAAVAVNWIECLDRKRKSGAV